MKLRSLENDCANIGDTEKEAFIRFGELTGFTSVNSNLSDSLSFSKHRNPQNGGYSLCSRYFGVLDPLVFGGIGNKYYLALKDIREAFVDIKRSFLEIEIAQTVGAYGNQILFLRIER
jgi:hypothetical protein